VTGFDGSPASRAAVSLALRHAGAGGRIVVVHAFKAPADVYGRPDRLPLLEAAFARARDTVERLTEEVPGLAAADWEYELTSGSPTDAILRVAEAAQASEIVIGTRGVGRLRGVLGSVAHEVLHRARCPVVVVPQRALAEVPA
jgi:nucleotide-binding universal stress UspA family protein